MTQYDNGVYADEITFHDAEVSVVFDFTFRGSQGGTCGPVTIRKAN